MKKGRNDIVPGFTTEKTALEKSRQQNGVVLESRDGNDNSQRVVHGFTTETTTFRDSQQRRHQTKKQNGLELNIIYLIMTEFCEQGQKTHRCLGCATGGSGEVGIGEHSSWGGLTT